MSSHSPKRFPIQRSLSPHPTLSRLKRVNHTVPLLTSGLSLCLLVMSTTPPFPSMNMARLSGWLSGSASNRYSGLSGSTLVPIPNLNLLPLTTATLTTLYPAGVDILLSLTVSDEDHHAQVTKNNPRGKHPIKISSNDDSTRQGSDRYIIGFKLPETSDSETQVETSSVKDNAPTSSKPKREDSGLGSGLSKRSRGKGKEVTTPNSHPARPNPTRINAKIGKVSDFCLSDVH